MIGVNVRLSLTAVLALTLTQGVAYLGTGRADAATSHSRASMVIVSSNIAAHRDAIGAGVVVVVQPNRIRVITARHVAEHGPVSIWIAGRPFAAEIVRTFLRRDLAILDAFGRHFDRLGLEPVQLTASTAQGNELTVWGENETGLHDERARVLSPNYMPPDGDAASTPLLSIACSSCAPGDSGGGIFDATGHLVAILTARYYTHDDRTVAIVGEPIDSTVYEITDGPFELAATTGRAP